MSFNDASATRVLINEKHLSGSIDGWEFTASRNLSQVTTILDTGTKWIPSVRVGGVSLTGLFNSAAGDINEEIGGSIGVDNALIWSIFPTGLTLGQPALIVVSELDEYKVTSKVGAAVSLSVTGTPDDGAEIGVQLHALGAETADTDSTSVDNTAGTANGGAGNLHVTAFSGLTSAVVKVQHSSNNSTWADLATFTTVTSTTAERVAVATGTTVNRYLRSSVDVTGTGSVTFALSFARR